MSARTARLVPVRLTPSPQILLASDRLEMLRIHARSVPAEVVELKTILGERAHQEEMRQAMHCPLAATEPSLSISSRRPSSPEPTTRDGEQYPALQSGWESFKHIVTLTGGPLWVPAES